MVVLFLAACAAKLFWNISRVYDLSSQDENLMYLMPAVDWLHGALTTYVPAPLYSGWYYLTLKATHGNAVSAYYLNYQLLGLLLPILFYAAARAYRVAPIAAGIVSWFVLISAVNIDPLKNATFSVMVVFVGVVVSAATDNRFVKAAVVAAFAYLASFVRPEYVAVAAILLLGGLIWSAESKWWRSRRDLALAIVAVAVAAVGFWVLRPLRQDSERLLFAFAQHFAGYWESKFGDGDGYIYPYLYLHKVFGPVHSIGGALLANPKVFAVYLAHNLVLTVMKLYAAFVDHVCILAPATTVTYCRAESGALPLVALGVAWIVWRRRLWTLLSPVFRLDPFHRLLVASSSIFLGVTVLIYPRTHYFFFIMAVGLFGCLCAAARALPKEKLTAWQTPAWLAAGGLILLGMTPYLSTNQYPAPDGSLSSNPDDRRPNVVALKALAPIVAGHGFRLGTDFVGIGAYLPSVQAVGRSDLLAAIDKGAVDGILVNDDMRADRVLNAGPQWGRLLGRPGEAGFAVDRLKSGQTLLVKRNWPCPQCDP